MADENICDVSHREFDILVLFMLRLVLFLPPTESNLEVPGDLVNSVTLDNTF